MEAVHLSQQGLHPAQSWAWVLAWNVAPVGVSPRSPQLLLRPLSSGLPPGMRARSAPGEGPGTLPAKVPGCALGPQHRVSWVTHSIRRPLFRPGSNMAVTLLAYGISTRAAKCQQASGRCALSDASPFSSPSTKCSLWICKVIRDSHSHCRRGVPLPRPLQARLSPGAPPPRALPG